MINKTKDYDSFIFRDDNREKIDQKHVERIACSIKSKNMLDLRPVIVNQAMEILDGQHRVLAAKMIGVEVYYQVERELTAQDMLKLNVSKNWGNVDYLNFYCHHQYDEYIKLKRFMEKNNISLRIAITIAIGQAHQAFIDFKEGNFKFVDEEVSEHIDTCWETVRYIQKINGFSNYLNSSRFWKALIILFRHPSFNKVKWLDNTKKLTDSFYAKASIKDYVSLVQTVYNWRNPLKVELEE